jgi:flavodoxin
MKSLVLYDSYFGNTEKVAQKIHSSLGENATIKKAENFEQKDLEGINLLIVGSPTRGFNYSERMKPILGKIPENSLEEIKIASFDTRIDEQTVKPRILKFLMSAFGYAAEKIQKTLEKKGGEKIIEPMGFVVKDSEGPLQENELEEAGNWAKKIMEAL